MIRVYKNGHDFLQENREFLDTNPGLSSFFVLDAPLLRNADKANYAIRAGTPERPLLALKVEPYNLLLFGCEEAVGELLAYLTEHNFEFGSFFGGDIVCGEAVRVFRERYGIVFEEALAMDYMEAAERTEASSPDITVPTPEDLEDILECLSRFILDCGLQDKVDEDKTRQTLQDFRILRADGKIVCMAKLAPDTDRTLRISDVYTRPEYRGRGCARQVVNSLKNEILEQGKIAALNVDKHNPVTNHLYRSLGFVPIFSQGEYRRKQNG